MLWLAVLFFIIALCKTSTPLAEVPRADRSGEFIDLLRSGAIIEALKDGLSSRESLTLLIELFVARMKFGLGTALSGRSLYFVTAFFRLSVLLKTFYPLCLFVLPEALTAFSLKRRFGVRSLKPSSSMGYLELDSYGGDGKVCGATCFSVPGLTTFLRYLPFS